MRSGRQQRFFVANRVAREAGRFNRLLSRGGGTDEVEFWDRGRESGWPWRGSASAIATAGHGGAALVGDLVPLFEQVFERHVEFFGRVGGASQEIGEEQRIILALTGGLASTRMRSRVPIKTARWCRVYYVRTEITTPLDQRAAAVRLLLIYMVLGML